MNEDYETRYFANSKEVNTENYDVHDLKYNLHVNGKSEFLILKQL